MSILAEIMWHLNNQGYVIIIGLLIVTFSGDFILRKILRKKQTIPADDIPQADALIQLQSAPFTAQDHVTAALHAQYATLIQSEKALSDTLFSHMQNHPEEERAAQAAAITKNHAFAENIFHYCLWPELFKDAQQTYGEVLQQSLQDFLEDAPYQRAQEALKTDDMGYIASLLTEYIQPAHANSTQQAQAYFMLGYTALLQLQQRQAAEYFIQAVHMDTQSGAYLYAAIHALNIIGEHAQAWDYILKAEQANITFTITQKLDILQSKYAYARHMEHDGDALDYLQQAMHILQENPQHNPLEMAAIYDRLSLLYYDLGHYDKLIKTQEKSLAIKQKTLAHDHLAIAYSYLILALVAQARLMPHDAIDFYTKSLEIYKQKLGDNHVKTAAIYSNLAMAYASINKYEQARILAQKAIEIHEDTLGTYGLYTADAYNRLANIGILLRKFDEAEEYIQKENHIITTLCDTKPSRTIAYHGTLAQLYTASNQYEKALIEHQKSIALAEEHFGEEHPSIAIAYERFGHFYAQQKKHNAALPLYEKSMEIHVLNHGEHSLRTALCSAAIANVYLYKHKYLKSMRLFQRAHATAKLFNHPPAMNYTHQGVLITKWRMFRLIPLTFAFLLIGNLFIYALNL